MTDMYEDSQPLGAQDLLRPADVIPTLFVGLGGQGRRIAENLKVRLEERYEAVPGKYHEHIKFFCADTNVHESFGASFPSDPNRPKLELAGDELFSLSNTPIEDLKNGSHPLGRLLPPELYSDQIYQGAQQIRRLGRVSLLYHYTNFRNKLEIVINRLLQPDKNPPPGALQRLDDKRLQVYIVCSICGGTGSGTFIDTAFIIRDIMRRYKTIATNVIGVFLMPEVLNVQGSARARIRANAYAALLDLEYFNQPSQVGDPLYQVDLGEAGSLSANGEPFSQCYLVQGNDRYNDIEQIAPILGDALETLICTEIGAKIDGVQDNIRPQFTRYPNGFRTFYSALGIERVIIPEKRLRRLRANQDMRILIRHFILGERLLPNFDVSAAETTNAMAKATGEANAEARQAWDEFTTRLDESLKGYKNTQNRVSFAREDRRWLTEALEFVQPELNHSSDPVVALQQACAETENRLFALGALRQESLAKMNIEVRNWLLSQVLDRLKLNWENGGGLEWLRSWLTELEKEVAKARGQAQEALAQHQRLLSDTPQYTRNQLVGLETTGGQRGLGGMFDSRKKQARQIAAQFLQRFDRLWEGERSRLIDSARADLAAVINEWQQTLSGIITEWRAILLRLEAERKLNLRFDAEQAQVIIPPDLRDEQALLVKSTAEVEQKVKAFAGYLKTQANMRAGFAAVLLTDADGSARVARHLTNWAYDPARALTSDRVVDIILADPDKEARRRRWRSLLDNAKPLLNYAAAKLETPPDPIAYLNTNVLNKAELPPGYEAVNPLDTHDPYMLTLLRTEHAIPFNVLEAFDEYRDSYHKSLRGANPIFHLTNELENEPFDPSSRYFVNPREAARHFALAVAIGAISQTRDNAFDITKLGDSLSRAQRALRETVERELYDMPSNDINMDTIKRYQAAARAKQPTSHITLNALERRYVQLEDRIEDLKQPVEKVFAFVAPLEVMYDQCTRYKRDNPDRVTLFRRALDLYRSDLIKTDREQQTLRNRYNNFLRLRIRKEAGEQVTGEDWTDDRFEPVFAPTDNSVSALEQHLCRHVLAELRQLNRTLWSSKPPRAGYWLDSSYRREDGS